MAAGAEPRMAAVSAYPEDRIVRRKCSGAVLTARATPSEGPPQKRNKCQNSPSFDKTIAPVVRLRVDEWCTAVRTHAGKQAISQSPGMERVYHTKQARPERACKRVHAGPQVFFAEWLVAALSEGKPTKKKNIRITK
ncbi:hypothetical protein NDU88_006902 [Pleurodeles waltl]|uniref:Uncharacterized protein n=1 Tax=Pleurodeles waltl TaxID=8319 RepID=A0AAV7VRZ8_PLEWA|nr:hypothetical protein NDU88_006902 [Pleurodeles waltl]